MLFGTPVGRVLSLYFLLPVIGSYVALEGAQHVIVGLILKHTIGIDPEIATPWSFVGGAVFLFLLIHAPPFRHAVMAVLRVIGIVLRAILFAGPLWFFRMPVVRVVMRSLVGR